MPGHLSLQDPFKGNLGVFLGTLLEKLALAGGRLQARSRGRSSRGCRRGAKAAAEPGAQLRTVWLPLKGMGMGSLYTSWLYYLEPRNLQHRYWVKGEGPTPV